MRYWWCVDLPYACFGIETVGGLVCTAPPIAKWMVGKSFEQVKRWVQSKNGTIAAAAK